MIQFVTYSSWPYLIFFSIHRHWRRTPVT
jgi:hypothetical protein